MRNKYIGYSILFVVFIGFSILSSCKFLNTTFDIIATLILIFGDIVIIILMIRTLIYLKTGVYITGTIVNCKVDSRDDMFRRMKALEYENDDTNSELEIAFPIEFEKPNLIRRVRGFRRSSIGDEIELLVINGALEKASIMTGREYSNSLNGLAVVIVVLIYLISVLWEKLSGIGILK